MVVEGRGSRTSWIVRCTAWSVLLHGVVLQCDVVLHCVMLCFEDRQGREVRAAARDSRIETRIGLLVIAVTFHTLIKVVLVTRVCLRFEDRQGR
jgi:hypothetical protein